MTAHAFDAVRLKIAQGRKDKNGSSLMRTESAKEREIQARLNKPIQVNFHNVYSQVSRNSKQLSSPRFWPEFA